MLSQEESGRVFALLKSEHRPVEEIVSDFTSKFPRHHHFAICYSLLLLLEDKKALNSTERLVAYAILHQAYSSQQSSANPFISLIINTSCDDEAEKYERAFILQLLSSGLCGQHLNLNVTVRISISGGEGLVGPGSPLSHSPGNGGISDQKNDEDKHDMDEEEQIQNGQSSLLGFFQITLGGSLHILHHIQQFVAPFWHECFNIESEAHLHLP
ncbi:hypothetical protein LWI28_016122 [Acer negundo]|uniref:CCR4-NOT transcription complex subunit 11 n=1 Tax=Acer negundo TaxID=4023 RepID=A0AAD5IIM8_ACENE|nr:hypothetical protein LWI28_016122 [Acer negundo]